MEELITSLHLHTRYSDGHATHQQLAQIALKNGIDVLLTTDHNVYVQGVDGYYEGANRKLLLLAGEEIHDQGRNPQKSHLLVFGAGRELATFAPEPQNLINQVNRYGGLPILAHPYERALPAFHEPDISWDDWDVDGYAGLELWNGLSEFKTASKTVLHALFYALFPSYLAHGPDERALEKWDSLLAQGKRLTAVGGADAHALPVRLGPIRRTLYPYAYHFQAVTTHLLTTSGLSGNLLEDRRMVMEALRQGHAFIGYDLPAATSGFRFSGQGRNLTAIPGDEIALEGGVTFQIRLPQPAECQLIKDGTAIKVWRRNEFCTFMASQPGVYRVACYIQYRGRRRTWILSNPIYVRTA